MENFKEFMQDNFGWLLAVLRSRKFWVLLFSALASYGLDITPELQALIIMVAGIVFASLTAYEDVASKTPAVVKLPEVGLYAELEDPTPVE